MQRFFVIILIYFLCLQMPADAFFPKKKNYKKIILENALSSEKRNNHKAAFHSFEKALYYYKKDKEVLETYAEFSERHKYYDKAQELYQTLYILTKDKKYLFKSNFISIINGKISDAELSKLIETKNLTSFQKTELNKALVNHYSYKNNWQKAKVSCDKIPIKQLDKNVIVNCIVAEMKSENKKKLLAYYVRFFELNPDDSEILTKVIETAEKSGDYSSAHKYLKKLSSLNPSDNGIKYRIAGLHEKQKNWKKAAEVYEELMKKGDQGDHVKKSYEYVLSQLFPKKESLAESKYRQETKPAPPKLTEREKTEKELYAALEAKKYSKTLEITEKLLQKYPKEKKYLVLALENSMAIKNWDKAQIYNDKLLELTPDSEALIKTKGDLYSIKKDFPNAIKNYENLIEKYPKGEYIFTLANLYMANQNFLKAEETILPLYEAFPENKKVVEVYLNSLLAQQKIKDAYWVIKNHSLENTLEGHIVLGDMAMMDKDYKTAAKKYRNAVELEPENTVSLNKLAGAYKMLGYTYGPAKIYEKILEKEEGNKEARLGLGYVEAELKNYDNARFIFNSLLKENPDYKPAKLGIVHSYISNGDNIKALDLLENLEKNDETDMLRGQIYYDLNMFTNAKENIQNMDTKDASELRYKIRKNDAITIKPSYSFMIQTLAEQFKLDADRFDLQVSKNINDNTNVFLDYKVIWYQSGGKVGLSNVVNEFSGGAKSRINEKWEYQANLGVKAFQYGGGMILSDSWVKYYVNDKFNLKAGYYRNNIEQSYLAAVGAPIDGVFTGRCANNRFYLEFEGRLPYDFYYFGRGVYGLVYSQNLTTNQYSEGMIGAGKLLYNNPKNPWINLVAFDVVSFNTSFQYNQLLIFDSAGKSTGGYFSPGYFNATTGNIKVEGNIKKLKLKYGIKSFGGIQNALSPDQTTLTWGVTPYITYDINENVSFNGEYMHFNFADIMRDIFTVNLVIRGFKHDKK